MEVPPYGGNHEFQTTKSSRLVSLELSFVVGTARFELATSSTPRKRATKLRHVPSTHLFYTF